MSKFSPKTKYTIVQRDIPIREFYDYREEYVVRPPYQRKTVWSIRKQQGLLDSLFRSYYIPRIVIREVRLSDHREVSEVIDGQQRITTVQNFLADQLTLPKSLADIDRSLSGLTYSELTSDIRRFVDRLSYQADIVKGIDDPRNPEHQEIATSIFWRLQQGESLNYMEVAHSRLSSLVRNFVVKYGDDQRFDYEKYEPIDSNLDKHDFFKIVARSNDRMQHLGLLARLLLIEEADGPTDLKNSNIAKYIDGYQQQDGIGNWSMESKPQAKRVLRHMKAFYEIFKDDQMVIAGNGMKEFKDEYVIVSVYLLLRHLVTHYVFTVEEQNLFRDFVLDFSGRLRGARRGGSHDLLIFTDHRQQSSSEIEVRDQIIRQMFFEFAKSKGHEMHLKDGRRAFNEAERINIYRRDKGLCQKCLSEGKLEQEALVAWSEYEADHIIPHSQGGVTSMTNAQVLCRYHNRAKGASM